MESLETMISEFLSNCGPHMMRSDRAVASIVEATLARWYADCVGTDAPSDLLGRLGHVYGLAFDADKAAEAFVDMVDAARKERGMRESWKAGLRRR